MQLADSAAQTSPHENDGPSKAQTNQPVVSINTV